MPKKIVSIGSSGLEVLKRTAYTADYYICNAELVSQFFLKN